MSIGKLAVVLVVLLAAGAVAFQVMRNNSNAGPGAAARAGPPPGAIFVEESPEAIIGTVASVQRQRRDSLIQNEYAGLWVPGEGWEGVVEKITNERAGPALRLHRPSSTTVGGGVWIIALVAHDHGINIGERVWVQGVIRDVKTQSDGVSVAMSVVLDDARVVRK